MTMITDFDVWLDAIILETQEEAGDLLDSVRNITEAGNYTTTRRTGRFYVKGPGPDTLLLANEKARTAFIAELERIYVTLLDDLEAGFKRNMDDPHS
jgi:hypothetical protein